MRNAIDKKLLPLDLSVCAKDTATDDTINAAYEVSRDYNQQPEGTSKKPLAARPDLDQRYINRVRLRGIKFWLDGSPDSYWMTQSFSLNPPEKTGAFRGYQQIPNEVLDAAFDKYWTTNRQINRPDGLAVYLFARCHGHAGSIDSRAGRLGANRPLSQSALEPSTRSVNGTHCGRGCLNCTRSIQLKGNYSAKRYECPRRAGRPGH